MKSIAVIYGGFSGERVISERSAKVAAECISSSGFKTYLVDINRDEWLCKLGDANHVIDRKDFSIVIGDDCVKFDGVFNAIHGTPGEDGKIQGYFDLIGMPYNNCGVLASALTFNKAACNAYLSAHGVSVATSYIVRIGQNFDVQEIVERVGLPCFVKPNDGGSSIGITRVSQKSEVKKAVLLAQEEGVDALIESLLVGVEVSCGCISIDGKPKSIGVTEIIPGNEFFDFESKYNHAGTKELTPARLPADVYCEVESLTEKIYNLLNCKGMVRVDYMAGDEGIYLIEVNTTPGLSEASIIPAQAVHAGYSLQEFFAISVEEMLRESQM